MGKILTLARREMAGYFFSPLAYVVGALFFCVCAFKFFPPPAFWSGSREDFILVPNQQAMLRPLFDMMAIAMIFAAPLLTMRLVSEEYRAGTIETLVTAPITDAQVILGKYLGVLLFYFALLASTVVFLVFMSAFAEIDVGVVAMGYLGMILMGMAFLAVGLFASTLTKYQVLAAVAAMVTLLLLAVAMEPIAAHTPEPWSKLASQLDAMRYLRGFFRGLFDSRGLVFFLSLATGFLYLSVKSLEFRRWR